MPVGSLAARERLKPLVLAETDGLSEEAWLAYRRKGIGGSDVAALLGISPWRTARDLYYDKLNIAAVEDNEGNWVALEMGHLLEPLVAKIFERKQATRRTRSKRCSSTQNIPGCWRMWTILWNSQMAQPPSWKSRPRTTTPGITGGWMEKKRFQSTTNPKAGTIWLSWI